MDTDEVIIEEVRKHPAIYDLSSEEYKSLKRKELAWQEVAKHVNLEDGQCRKRWKGLRDCYKRCKRSEIIASGSGAVPPKNKWKYYDSMSFLDKVQSSRSTVDNISSSEVLDDVIVLGVEDVEVTMTEGSSVLTSQTPPSHSRKGNKQKTDNFNDFLDKASASISQTCSLYASRTKDCNPTLMAFTSLAETINEAKMPINVVNKIKAKVSQVVYEEIEKFFNNKENTDLT